MSSEADVPSEGRFRVTIPSIDPAELNAAVAERQNLFVAPVPQASIRSPETWEALRRALDDLDARIAALTRRCAPRTELPRRLARFGFASVPLLRAYNYLTKTQREIVGEQTAALASLVAALRLALDVYDD